MCLRYAPTMVACVCIHLACKWSNYKIPMSAQNKEWFQYVDPTATLDLLERLTEEFLNIFERCPSKLKKKIKASADATRHEEERRAKNDVSANHFQLDISTRPDSSSKPGHHHGQHGQRSSSGRPMGPGQTSSSSQHRQARPGERTGKLERFFLKSILVLS